MMFEKLSIYEDQELILQVVVKVVHEPRALILQKVNESDCLTERCIDITASSYLTYEDLLIIKEPMEEPDSTSMV